VKSPIVSRLQLGYNQRLSGDVVYITNPGFIEYGMQGTTHGSPFTYDTHVPALFYGFGVKKGETYQPQTICDIASTVAAICRIPLPSAAIGQPIEKIVK
jgi:phosphopentomutase